MKIVVAPQGYKECLSASDVCDLISAGVLKVFPKAKIDKVPFADGGEGTVDILTNINRGRIVEESVEGPLGKRVRARYGILEKGETAVIEVASASGLSLIPLAKRNPMFSSSFGTGQLILSAFSRGCRKIILGLGGSATVDGGAGILQALGIKFLDRNGRPIKRGGGYLKDISKIEEELKDNGLKKLRFIIACDVTNPLLGENGAAKIYGPQKGASGEDVKKLEKSLAHFKKIMVAKTGKNFSLLPGTGAAGGIAFGILSFFKTKIIKGADFVIKFTDLERKIRSSDLVVTGEGQLDEQTMFGKAPSALAKIANRYKIPVICVSGNIRCSSRAIKQSGINGAVSTVCYIMNRHEAFDKAPFLIEQATIRALELIKIGRNNFR